MSKAEVSKLLGLNDSEEVCKSYALGNLTYLEYHNYFSGSFKNLAYSKTDCVQTLSYMHKNFGKIITNDRKLYEEEFRNERRIIHYVPLNFRLNHLNKALLILFHTPDFSDKFDEYKKVNWEELSKDFAKLVNNDIEKEWLIQEFHSKVGSLVETEAFEDGLVMYDRLNYVSSALEDYRLYINDCLEGCKINRKWECVYD